MRNSLIEIKPKREMRTIYDSFEYSIAVIKSTA